MAARNDITGDELKSRGNSKAFTDNFDRIFGKKKPKEPEQLELDFGDEHRIDVIGQNGNTGEHYE